MSDYIERTNVIASPPELAAILQMANTSAPASAQLLSTIYASALRHGLPALKQGHYGIDLASGEFLSSV